MPLLTELPSVSLTELERTASLQQRLDQKYVVPLAVIDDLAAVPGLRRLEIGGESAFTYRTTYLDTPDAYAYHAHRQGRRLRWKARTRCYADSGLQRFEVKLKSGRGGTDKRAVQLPSGAPVLSEPALGFLQTTLLERCAWSGPLRVVVALEVEQRRTTLWDPASGERITIDTGVRFRGPSPWRGELLPDRAIVEVKSAVRPGPVSITLRRMGQRAVRLSKYCVGRSLLDPSLPEQPWRRVRDLHFRRLVVLP